MTCDIGQPNELLFSFQGISRPDLTNIGFEFTNFKNPWSAITIQSIRVASYRSTDCSGDAESSKKIGSATFFPQEVSEENFSLVSTTTVLGNDDPANEVIFRLRPTFPFSLDGTGLITI